MQGILTPNPINHCPVFGFQIFIVKGDSQKAFFKNLTSLSVPDGQAIETLLWSVSHLITATNIKFYQNMEKIILMLHLHIQGLEDGLYNQIM